MWWTGRQISFDLFGQSRKVQKSQSVGLEGKLDWLRLDRLSSHFFPISFYTDGHSYTDGHGHGQGRVDVSRPIGESAVWTGSLESRDRLLFVCLWTLWPSLAQCFSMLWRPGNDPADVLLKYPSRAPSISVFSDFYWLIAFLSFVHLVTRCRVTQKQHSPPPQNLYIYTHW